MQRSFGFSDKVFNFFNYVIFIIIGILMLYPLWFVLMFSFSNPKAAKMNNFYLLPTQFNLDSYRFVLSRDLIYTGYLNTIFVTVIGTILCLTVLSFAAYPLSRIRLRGKKFFLLFFLFTMYFSGGMVPTYMVIRQLGLIDSLWALILPRVVSIYFMLIIIRFFQAIPDSLIESAKLDGCNDIMVLFRIVLPTSTSVLAAIGLFSAVSFWNEYLIGVMYINSMEKSPIQVILYQMLRETIMPANLGGFEQSGMTPESVKMSLVIVALMPIIMIYPFLQKHFMSGVMLGAVKG